MTQQATEAQRRAARELRRISRSHPDSVELLARPEVTDGRLVARIRLPTGDLDREPGGLPVATHEDVVVSISRAYPWVPPTAAVEHWRFAGHPHVLAGSRLCVYLDPAREWSTTYGMVDFLERLWAWFSDAAADRFDRDEVLYHAVGGVLHESPERSQTVVVRTELPHLPGLQMGGLTQRTDSRLDLSTRLEPGAMATLIVVLSDPLYYGAGVTLGDLLATIDHPRLVPWTGRAHHGRPSIAAVLTGLRAAAVRSGLTSLRLVLVVPDPRAGRHHVLVAGLDETVAADLASSDVMAAPNSLSGGSLNTQVHWHPVSDERRNVTTRRDESRPTAALEKRKVLLLGCGGLGSWIAEYLVRAGVEQIVLCDPGRVIGGLLVRQNFLEADIGRFKSEALKDRLDAARDDVIARALTGAIPVASDPIWRDVDLIIDATASVAAGELLDAVAVGLPKSTVLARVATDVATATLGLLSVNTGGPVGGLAGPDLAVEPVVAEEDRLDAFRTFWDPSPHGELVPEPGCSVPTFHGSAADTAALAATVTTLVARQVRDPHPGTHLVSMPGSPTGAPAHTFLPY